MAARAPVRVVVAVIRGGSRFWVQRRREAGPLDGSWEFPGGKPRRGESDADALVREVREETGARVEPGPLLCETTHAYPDRAVRLRFYAATLAPGSPPLPADDAHRWVTLAELRDLPIPAANAPLLDVLRAGM